MGYFRQSLKTFLTLNFLFIAIVPVIVIGCLSLHFLRQNFKEEITAKNFILAETLASEVEIFLKEPLNLLAQTRDILEKENLVTEAGYSVYLDAILDNYIFFDMIQIISSSGVVISVSPHDPGFAGSSMLNQPFFKKSISAREPFWSEVFISPQIGYPAMTISMPFKNGVIAAYLDLEYLETVIERINRNGLGHAIITDQGGTVIVHNDESMVSERVNIKNLPEVQAGLGGREGTFESISEYFPDRGDEYLSSVAVIRPTGWLVIFKQNSSDAFYSIRKLSGLIVSGILITGFIVILWAIAVLGKVFRPLSDLLESTRKIANGEYSFKFEKHGFKELAELATDFSVMANSVRQREGKLRFRLLFENIISGISSEFINLSGSGLGREFRGAVEKVASHIKADRAYVYIMQADRNFASCLCEWCGDNSCPPPYYTYGAILTEQEMPWLFARMKSLQPVFVPKVSGLGDDARIVKKIWADKGVESLLCIPMMSQEKLTGFIGFDAFDDNKGWSFEIISFLRLLSEIFVSFMERNQVISQMERLRTAIDQTSEFMTLMDNRAVIEYVNPAFTRVTGFEPSELKGQDFLDFTETRCVAGDFDSDLIRNTIMAGNSYSARFTSRRKDGRQFEQETSISPIRDSAGDISGFVSVNSDVTEKVEMEMHIQQSHKMDSLGTLAGGIAHDFNNILNAIVGFTELAIMKIADDSQVADYLGNVIDASTRATDLVRQILTFSRQQKADIRPVLLHLPVRESLRLLRAVIPATVTINENISEPGAVMADPTELHQVIMNICTNAYHAMTPAGGTITVSLEDIFLSADYSSHIASGLEPGHYALLSVADTGAGIEPSILDRIFDPYFTTKGKGKGTGLGLSVVHGIIRKYGGAIHVHTELGNGSDFRIYLPLTDMPDTEVPEISEPLAEGRGHILVVDDERILMEVASQMLESAGYTVTGETSSLRALEIFRQSPENFDLVMTDLTMPEITGDLLAAEISLISPKTPVVLCTGYYSDNFPEKTCGISRILQKPLNMRELFAAVKELIDEKMSSES